MNVDIFENTKLSAYFLWESTQHDNAMSLWYCVEDIACYFERIGLVDLASINIMRNRSKYDMSYIEFVRNIAYRIHVYTNNTDSIRNWYAAERLLDSYEWRQATTNIASVYLSQKDSDMLLGEIRSDNVKSYYRSFHPGL